MTVLWHRGKFKIALNPRCTWNKPGDDGTRAGAVTVDGLFGIHRETDSKQFIITHIPSGMKLPGPDPYADWPKQGDAKEAVQRLLAASNGMPWSSKEPLKPLSHDERSRLLKILTSGGA